MPLDYYTLNYVFLESINIQIVAGYSTSADCQAGQALVLKAVDTIQNNY